MIGFRFSCSTVFFVMPWALGCGSSQSSTPITLPSFSDVSQAPPAIQAAAKAVVRIGTNGEVATGSFISPQGLLLTNNHVLGVDICPVEGCFATITRNYQRHVSPVSTPVSIFVVPVAVDVGLDMALLQAYTADRSQMLSTPDYLTIANQTPAMLQGAHVNVVGHPEGHLKKWTQGEIVDSTGDWVEASAYILPGDSGSPFLDDAGRMVGLLHRGPAAQDLISGAGLDEFSIGTASASLITAMAVTTLPAAMLSTAASTTDDVVVQHNFVYLNARTPMANVNGLPKAVITSLAEACDAGLARQNYESPEDLASAVAPCTDAEFWINCNAPLTTDGSSVCPDDVSAWVTRFQAVYDHYVALNGSLQLGMVTSAMRALAPTAAQGLATAAQNLQTALAAAKPPLDFTIASYLATFGVTMYGTTATLDFLVGYKTVPGYALSGGAIAATAVELYVKEHLGATALDSILSALNGDVVIDIGTKLYTEDVLYQLAAIN